MATLWRIDKRNNMVIDKEYADLVPKLSKLKNDDLRFIVLAYDYRGPFKQFPKRDRILKAKRIVFHDDNNDAEIRLQVQIDEYVSHQYDEKRELMDIYKTKVQDLMYSITEENDPIKLKHLDVAITSFRLKMNELQREIDSSEEAAIMKGDRTLSYIEEWQLRMRTYSKDKSKQVLRKQQASEQQSK